LIDLINDDALVSAAMADACSMVHLVCFFFLKTHLLHCCKITVLTCFVLLSWASCLDAWGL